MKMSGIVSQKSGYRKCNLYMLNSEEGVDILWMLHWGQIYIGQTFTELLFTVTSLPATPTQLHCGHNQPCFRISKIDANFTTLFRHGLVTTSSI